jgi:uncharacterized protein
MVIREQDFHNLVPEAKKCMFTTTLIWVAVLILSALAAWLIIFLQDAALPWWADLLFAAWGLLWLIYLFASPAIRYRRYRYLIDGEKIVVREGLFFISLVFAPIERLHQITVKSGPIDRLYNLAKVIATTAGGVVVISFLPRQEAEDIAEMLQAKVRYILGQQGITLSSSPEQAAPGEVAARGEDADD